MSHTPPVPRRVAVIGGGYAGCAAAVELSQRGACVSLLEAGPELGGRARRVALPGEAGVVDNGQHLLIGAYRELLALIEVVGLSADAIFQRIPLDLQVHGAFRMRCRRLPAPWHSLLGLLQAQGLSGAERWAAIRLMGWARLAGFRLAQDISVSDWLAKHRQPPRLVQLLWEPLTLSALNTPMQQASAQVLLNVLRDSLAGTRADSDFLLPRVDLSACFPDAAAAFVLAQGGSVTTSHTVRHLVRAADGWRVDDLDEIFDAVVLALAPHRVASLAGDLPKLAAHLAPLATWHYQPIYTVYLRYPAGTRLPSPMLGFVGKTSHWVFDRGALMQDDGLMAVVISAEGPHTAWPHKQLAANIAAELREAFPQLPAPLWHKVIAEKRATFACTPKLQRPSNATPEPGLWLAGDYTAGDYPATLEGAVRSGLAAARGIYAV